jgi:hypothetical protein
MPPNLKPPLTNNWVSCAVVSDCLSTPTKPTRPLPSTSDMNTVFGSSTAAAGSIRQHAGEVADRVHVGFGREPWHQIIPPR